MTRKTKANFNRCTALVAFSDYHFWSFFLTLEKEGTEDIVMILDCL